MSIIYNIETMETENLTAEQSFDLITKVISEAKSKFEENGFIYVFWGTLTVVATLSQYILLKNEMYEINYYPYFIMPLGAIFAYFFMRKRTKQETGLIGKLIGGIWLVLTFNFMLLGFLFNQYLRENMVPVFLILLATGTIASGISIRSRLVLFSGIVINLAGLICFYLE